MVCSNELIAMGADGDERYSKLYTIIRVDFILFLL